MCQTGLWEADHQGEHIQYERQRELNKNVENNRAEQEEERKYWREEKKNEYMYVNSRAINNNLTHIWLHAFYLCLFVCALARRARRSPVDEQAIAHSRSPLHTIDSHSAAEPISSLSYHKTSSTSHCISHWMFFILIFFLFFVFFAVFKCTKNGERA